MIDNYYLNRKIESTIDEIHLLVDNNIHLNENIETKIGIKNNIYELKKIFQEYTIYNNTTSAISENSYKQIVESAPDAMILIEMNGNVILVNRNFRNLFGYENLELNGRNFSDFIAVDSKEQYTEILNKSASNIQNNTFETLSFELNAIKKNGVEFPVEINSSLIAKDDSFVLCVIHDLTSKKEKEKELKLSFDIISEQNKRLVNFAYIVSHNLRSHTGNLDMLLNLHKNAITQEEKDEMFTYMQNVSSALSETINNLNEVVLIQINTKNIKEKINLNAFLEKAIDTLSGEISVHKVIIENRIPPQLMLDYNAAYMESILLNFLSNAIKYRHPDRNPHIILDTYYDCNKLVLLISDNGRGIDLVKHGTKLFGMYKTFHGNPDAKGIGLFITNNQVGAMGGKIDVESEVNVGTSFKIYLS